MKKYIIVRCILLCFAVVMISGVISAIILQYTKEKDITQNMLDVLTVISMDGKPIDQSYEKFTEKYKNLSLDYRITVLSLNGDVLGDTLYDSESMENHAQRPEIKQAIAAGTGYEKRYSTTYRKNMLYVAKRQGDIIYRIAAPVDSVNATFWKLFPALIAGLLLAVFVSPVFAVKTADSIAKPFFDVAESLKPLGEGNYDVNIISAQYGEFQPIVDTINSLTKQISKSIKKLSEQKEKTEYLLDNMAEGLILIDSDLKVRQINSAARKFLNKNKSMEGENLLLFIYQKKLINAVKEAVENGKATLFDWNETETPPMILSAHVTPIQSDWLSGQKANGASILITDVTPKRKAEQMRSEFVANASHELKTPITSVSGFAELLAAGVVKDEKKEKEYLVRIQSETRRMAALIDDILKLSRLENSEKVLEEYQNISIAKIIEQVRKNLEPQIAKKKITLIANIEDVTIKAVEDDIRTLIGNLIDNAIKYNRENGKITVVLKKESGKVRLTVEDTGIGIPLSHQSRIFERFYRVNQGCKCSVRGTGLGLSIVKHVAAKYGGSIVLQSAEGEGTIISVIFPL